MCSLVYDPKFDVRPSWLFYSLARRVGVERVRRPTRRLGVPSGSARVDRAGHASARASRSAARMSASSASPGEALTPRAREAWTGEDDARGERKDATPRMDVRAGFLAKYSRWSHDRPCLVFTSVFMAIIAISAVVALANLAEFNTDAGDKVRRLLSRYARKSDAEDGIICRPVFDRSLSDTPHFFHRRLVFVFAASLTLVRLAISSPTDGHERAHFRSGSSWTTPSPRPRTRRRPR